MLIPIRFTYWAGSKLTADELGVGRQKRAGPHPVSPCPICRSGSGQANKTLRPALHLLLSRSNLKDRSIAATKARAVRVLVRVSYSPPSHLRPLCSAGTSISRKWSAGSLTLMKLKGMSSEVLHVNLLSRSVSTRSADGYKRNQKISMSSTRSKKSGWKENTNESNADAKILQNNPSKLGTMTINELRTLARNVGIPSKGSKKDLVGALSSFSTKGENASTTSNDVPTDKDVLSMNEPVLPTNLTSKRKSRASPSESNAHNLVIVPEVTKSKQKRSRKLKLPIDGTEETLKNDSSMIKNDDELVDQMGMEMHGTEPWEKLAHKRPQAGWIPYNPKTMRPLHPTNDIKYLKIVSWNVNGLRALLKIDGFPVLKLAEKEDFDILCLQETKMKEDDVEKIKDSLIEGYANSYWTCSVSKLGYSGTVIVSRIKPISVSYGLGISDHDSEGRLITIEFDTFYLINAYVPNSGDGLKRLAYRINEWDPSLSRYMKELEQSKPVILTGDLNCAHEEIDIYNPAGNRRSAGFTIEERESFETNFLSKGFVDAFRKQHPNAVGYTYWGYRHGGRKTNRGWRLDYFLVSEKIVDKAYDSYTCPDINGSDHCPIGLILKL